MECRMRTGIFIACLCVAFAGFAVGGIEGSEHDFSGEGWNTEGELCQPCHTPHNAGAADVAAPLWNHEITDATFTLYSSPTLKGTVEQPRSVSKACLSCHDGTVALDSYGGKIGSEFVGGDAMLGTDLSDDHPVSIKWEHLSDGFKSPCANCHTFSPLNVISELPFYDGYIECATCHDAHAGTGVSDKLLRKPSAGSQICFHCHAK